MLHGHLTSKPILKGEELPFTSTWRGLEGILLSKDNYRIESLIRGT